MSQVTLSFCSILSDNFRINFFPQLIAQRNSQKHKSEGQAEQSQHTLCLAPVTTVAKTEQSSFSRNTNRAGGQDSM